MKSGPVSSKLRFAAIRPAFDNQKALTLPMSSLSLPPALATVMTVIYVVIAASVTADVLLKKSDVRGALGWIGIALFSPILGGLLYYLFGINRVTRRALKMSRLGDAQVSPPAPDEPPQAPANIGELFEVSERVTGGPLTAGNDLKVLEGGDVAYPQMLAAIAAAKRCIVLASYICRDDKAGNSFADELIAAHARACRSGCCWTVWVQVIFTPPSLSGFALPVCPPPASCTPGCPGACRFSTCAITENCWWWTAASPSWAA